MPLRAGWSGNSAVPAPDLLIPVNGSLRAVEIKTSGQKRMVVKKDDLEDIIEWSLEMSEIPTFPYLSIKFPYYEMQTYRIRRPWDLEAALEEIAEESELDARVTRSGNISFGNPSEYDTDVCSAQKSQGDGAALLRDLEEDEWANVQDGTRRVVGVHEVLKEHPNYWKSMGR